MTRVIDAFLGSAGDRTHGTDERFNGVLRLFLVRHFAQKHEDAHEEQAGGEQREEEECAAWVGSDAPC